MSTATEATLWTPRHHPMLIAAAVMMATFMEVLDTSIANVSLPHIAGNLSASSDESTWVLTSYLVANAIILPATNYLSGIFGRKRFLITCIIIFTLASALCGAAESLGFLVLARIFQGAGGGALQPISQAVLLESFPKEKRGQAMGLFAMGVIVAPIIGPTLGGWITENYSWRWIFYINLPVGIFAAFLAHAVLEDPPYLRRVRWQDFDTPGFGFLVVWLAALQYVLDKGQEDDWFGSPLILTLTLISAASFLAFIVRELTTPTPIVDLHIFKNRNFLVGSILVTMVGAILYGTTSAIPLFLQNLLGYNSLQAGYALSPRGVTAFIGALIASRLIGKISGRVLIGTGLALLSISMFIYGNINLHADFRTLLLPTLLSGLALTITFIPLSTMTMGTLSQQQIGNATGIFSLMRNLGGSIGIAALTTLVTRGAQANQALLVGHLSALNPIYEQTLAAARGALAPFSDPVEAAQRAQAVLYQTLQLQANAVSYLSVFRLLGVVCALGLLLLFLFKSVRGAQSIPGAH